MHLQNKLFLIVMSFFVFGEGMLGPIYAIFVNNVGGDVLAAGTAWSIFLFVSGIGIFLMGRIQDRYKSDKNFILLGYSLTSLGFLLGFLGYYFVSNVIQLFLVQAVLGVATTILVPARDSFYTRYLEKRNFASQWAAWEGIWHIVTGAAALAGALIAKMFGFKVLFLSMFALSLIGLAITIQLKDKDEH